MIPRRFSIGEEATFYRPNPEWEDYIPVTIVLTAASFGLPETMINTLLEYPAFIDVLRKAVDEIIETGSRTTIPILLSLFAYHELACRVIGSQEGGLFWNGVDILPSILCTIYREEGENPQTTGERVLEFLEKAFQGKVPLQIDEEELITEGPPLSDEVRERILTYPYRYTWK